MTFGLKSRFLGQGLSLLDGLTEILLKKENGFPESVDSRTCRVAQVLPIDRANLWAKLGVRGRAQDKLGVRTLLTIL